MEIVSPLSVQRSFFSTLSLVEQLESHSSRFSSALENLSWESVSFAVARLAGKNILSFPALAALP